MKIQGSGALQAIACDGISKNQIITLHRGDTFEASLFINKGHPLDPERYVLDANDKLYFGIMEANQPFEFALIGKMYTSEDLDEDGDVVIKIESKETEYVLPGTYYYEVKLEHTNEDETKTITTIIPKRKLFLVD